MEYSGLGFVGKRERESKPLEGMRDLGDSNWVCIQRLKKGNWIEKRKRERWKKVRESAEISLFRP